jgi:hypothetical protein
MKTENERLAVALHGIEPATFERCALIRDWLSDLGVDRLTLMVIPAADHHPFYQRSPALTEWLHQRDAAGDAIAQQGFVATRSGDAAAAEHVRSGRRLMRRAGLMPSGYYAPSVRHLLHARRELISSFDWWLAPGLWRAGASLRTRAALRVDIHPTARNKPSRVRALEKTLRREAGRRTPVTYDELFEPAAPQRAQALIVSHSE